MFVCLQIWAGKPSSNTDWFTSHVGGKCIEMYSSSVYLYSDSDMYDEYSQTWYGPQLLVTGMAVRSLAWRVDKCVHECVSVCVYVCVCIYKKGKGR